MTEASHKFPRLQALAGACALAALAGCATYPAPQPVATYPTTYPSTASAALEYGRITNVEYVPASATGNRPNVIGAVVGGVIGAVVGNQIGEGSGRTAATVLGGAAGAAIGSQANRDRTVTTTGAAYRITVLTDQGISRVYEVGATGDLRVGDRVRVENGVIYRA